MPVRLAINGTFEERGGRLQFVGQTDEPAGELPRIRSLSMRQAFRATTSATAPCALRLEFVRDASHGTAEDMLIYQLQYGQGHRGERNEFRAELWLIDDLMSGDASVLGRFSFDRAQVMEALPIDDDQGGPLQSATIHAYSWTYVNCRGNEPVSSNPNCSPIIAAGTE
jgi:hypothetical protein